MSSLSVVLLAAVAWKGARDDPVMLLLLILGALTSVAGMAMRWTSFQRDEKPNRPIGPDHAGRATPEAPALSPPHRAREGFARPASRR